MKERKRPAKNQRGKVLPISMDAGFFFERAVSSLDRYRYDKALKYFRKAVEYEPSNPVNHCNMAGILSEMGDYAASNEVLQTVLEEIDPSMTECYFYMANNYANMDMFEAAEEALIRYLEEDEQGQFLSEAEEMIDLLQYELDRPTKLKSIKSRHGVYEHDQARALLEEGKFAQAVKMLEELVQTRPDFLAARNNLALGYYYLGLFRKAVETVEEVLVQDPGNLHGLCNLAIFYQHAGNREALEELAGRLENIVPFHQEHVFKLATTMGILGRHEAAFGHFQRLMRGSETNLDASLYHYAAVAAYHTGRKEEAEKLWKAAKRLDPSSSVPGYYLNILSQEREHPEAEPVPVNYQYLLPFEEQMKRWEASEEGIPAEMKENPLIRSSFFWALRHGDHKTKLQVIQAMGLIADQEVEEALQAFLLEPDEDAYLKEMALFVLRNLGVNQPLPVRSGATTTLVDPSRVSTQLPVWRSEWQAVVDLALERMKPSFDLQQQHDMETLWAEFLTRLYPDTPTVSHLEGWAAALEYLTAKMHGQSVTYEQVAQKYNISASTARRYVQRVDEVCCVKEKLADIFPSVQ
ncbi:tetratricopeptide repeat protein [Paenibacillus barengoltzii]|uniref:Thioredoxin domain-containing protein n=1 Tax=Paenibacillus barengoltzii J12 TaxID=935846 RepID=A0ABY1LXA7_9BACL|nr:tetratricopeptide repeat protein [Paenibacillus barengoltzii]SMF25382.1 Thioredoxin domain-containing protein [Paenibacillus barengoltzii J12]